MIGLRADSEGTLDGERNTMSMKNGATKNGIGPALSPGQAAALAERETRALLGVSPDEAFEMLRRGELDGMAAEAEVTMLQFLVHAD